MDILGTLCTLWLLTMIRSGFLMAQFSTDLLYKEVKSGPKPVGTLIS